MNFVRVLLFSSKSTSTLTPRGAKIYVCCLCNYNCKWLDVQVFSDKHYKPYYRLLFLQGTLENSRTYRQEWARSSRCCGLVLSPGFVLYIVFTSLHLSPLDRIIQKIAITLSSPCKLNKVAKTTLASYAGQRIQF